jgi:hypothetical protein
MVLFIVRLLCVVSSYHPTSIYCTTARLHIAHLSAAYVMRAIGYICLCSLHINSLDL